MDYIWSQGMIDNIAKKVAEEPMEKVDEGNYEYSPKVPQHVIDEDLADRARERTRELRQMEMYDDEMWNWSGLR
jgi:hypothetical protein